MPYEVRHEGNQYCVYKKDGGKTLGCHPSQSKAERQIAAILISEHGSGSKSLDSDWWVSAGQLSDICDSCGDGARAMGFNAINLKAMPAQLINGLCSKLGGESGFFERCTGMNFGEFNPGDPQAFCAWLKHECTGKWPAEKSMPDDSPLRMGLLITSNAYRDRTREIIRQKALEDWVSRSWKGDMFTGNNPLLFWHGGDPLGDIVYASTEGPFLVEVAQERPDQIVNLMPPGSPPIFASVKSVWDAFQEMDTEWGASHEFLYLKEDGEDGVYDQIIKTESTVLPRKWAANAYTLFAVI